MLRCKSLLSMMGCLLLSLGLWSGRANAVRSKRLNLSELVEQSAAVFVGKVVAVDPGAGKRRGDVGTEIAFNVEDVLAGQMAVGDRFSFELGIGDLGGGEVLAAPGLPEFELGESYLVFFREGEWFVSPVVGLNQGLLRKFTVGATDYYADAAGRVVLDIDEQGAVLGGRVRGRALRGVTTDTLGDDGDRGTERKPNSDDLSPAVVTERVRGAKSAAEIRQKIKSVVERSGRARQSRDLRVRQKPYQGLAGQVAL